MLGQAVKLVVQRCKQFLDRGRISLGPFEERGQILRQAASPIRVSLQREDMRDGPFGQRQTPCTVRMADVSAAISPSVLPGHRHARVPQVRR